MRNDALAYLAGAREALDDAIARGGRWRGGRRRARGGGSTLGAMHDAPVDGARATAVGAAAAPVPMDDAPDGARAAPQRRAVRNSDEAVAKAAARDADQAARQRARRQALQAAKAAKSAKLKARRAGGASAMAVDEADDDGDDDDDMDQGGSSE